MVSGKKGVKYDGCLGIQPVVRIYVTFFFPDIIMTVLLNSYSG